MGACRRSVHEGSWAAIVALRDREDSRADARGRSEGRAAAMRKPLRRHCLLLASEGLPAEVLLGPRRPQQIGLDRRMAPLRLRPRRRRSRQAPGNAADWTVQGPASLASCCRTRCARLVATAAAALPIARPRSTGHRRQRQAGSAPRHLAADRPKIVSWRKSGLLRASLQTLSQRSCGPDGCPLRSRLPSVLRSASGSRRHYKNLKMGSSKTGCRTLPVAAAGWSGGGGGSSVDRSSDRRRCSAGASRNATPRKFCRRVSLPFLLSVAGGTEGGRPCCAAFQGGGQRRAGPVFRTKPWTREQQRASGGSQRAHTPLPLASKQIASRSTAQHGASAGARNHSISLAPSGRAGDLRAGVSSPTMTRL